MGTSIVLDGTQERVNELSKQSARLHLSEFWTEIKGLESDEPHVVAIPYVWHFDEVKQVLDAASDIVPLELADRRAVVFRNPAYGTRIATTPALYAAYSQYNPGEKATVHRHTANAARIGLLGEGGYTTVEGVKYVLRRGDIALTPTWTWHDHGNDGNVPNTWFDILDIPLMLHLNGLYFDSNFAEPDGQQSKQAVQIARSTENATSRTYMASGVIPSDKQTKSGQRMCFYPWQATRAALERSRHEEMDPYLAHSVRLVDPSTGSSPLKTIDFSAHLLPPATSSRARRASCSTILLIMEGSGYSEINGKRFDWSENDVVSIPNWAWHRHVNTGAESSAVFYSMTDTPLYAFLDAFRQQE